MTMNIFDYQAWILKKQIKVVKGKVIAGSKSEAERLIREIWSCKPNQIVIICKNKGAQNVVA